MHVNLLLIKSDLLDHSYVQNILQMNALLISVSLRFTIMQISEGTNQMILVHNHVVSLKYVRKEVPKNNNFII